MGPVSKGRVDFTKKALSEKQLTHAIIQVTRARRILYFLTGHGERTISDEAPVGYKQAAEAIKKENYLVKEFNPTGTKKLARASVNKPIQEASQEIIDLIKDKLNKLPL